jgi:hypothetical protein
MNRTQRWLLATVAALGVSGGVVVAQPGQRPLRPADITDPQYASYFESALGPETDDERNRTIATSPEGFQLDNMDPPRPEDVATYEAEEATSPFNDQIHPDDIAFYDIPALEAGPTVQAPIPLDDAICAATDSCQPTTTVALTPLFRARNGDTSRGELIARIYLERDVTAGGLNDVDSDGDGWALVGRTNGDGDNGPLARFWVTNGVPFVTTRHPQKGCLQLTPQSLAQVKTGQTRLMSEVAQNTALCRTAPPEGDVDSNGIADNVQPLYRARNGDPAKGELAARVYVERGLNASEAQMGVSDYDSDGDGWALIGRTNGAGDNGQYVSIAMNGTTPVAKVQHPSKGCITIAPISIELVKRGQTRFVTITSQSPGACT